MAQFKDAYTEHQLKRWMRPDAHNLVRSDWRRHMPSASDFTAVFASYEQKYREDQLRDDLGRFAYEGRDKPSRVRLASSEMGPLGPRSRLLIALEAARTAFEAYRSAQGLRDLFGHNVGTLAYTELNGKGIYGVNSTSGVYDTNDRAAADKMRDALIRDFPDYFDKDNIGWAPNNAVYHAETTALLRAAHENGGTLKRQELEVHVDAPMCPNCESALPYVGLELDNPTVTFVGPKGERRTIRDGRWVLGR
jgi:hypothetical protein